MSGLQSVIHTKYVNLWPTPPTEFDPNKYPITIRTGIGKSLLPVTHYLQTIWRISNRLM